jgi:hypothetical protein
MEKYGSFLHYIRPNVLQQLHEAEVCVAARANGAGGAADPVVGSMGESRYAHHGHARACPSLHAPLVH